MLTQEQLDFYSVNGYLVLENFASGSEVQAMRDRAMELLENFDPQSVSLFSGASPEKMKEEYFLKSASNVSFFLEEGAVDATGNLLCEKTLAVNKIAHALHDLDPVFRAYSRSSEVSSVLKDLAYKRPLPVQSMYVCKQPRIGGKVNPHQENTYIRTDPPSVIGLWLAVEDATLENGCLYVLPKSHNEKVPIRFSWTSDGPVKEVIGIEKQRDLDSFVALPTAAGTLVVLHGNVVHFSQENTSSKSRHAYTVHYVEGTPDHKWEEDNWLQRTPDLPFEPLYES